MKDVNYTQQMRQFHSVMGMALDEEMIPEQKDTFDLRWRLISEEMQELFHECANISQTLMEGDEPSKTDKAALLKEMVDVVYVILGMAVSFSLPFDPAWGRVHQSNMSKLVDGKPLRSEDGKVLKGPNYQPPNIKGLL